MSHTITADDVLIPLLSGHLLPTLAESLAQLRDEERETVFSILLALLSDPDRWLRHVAVVALGALGDRRAVDPLIHTLDEAGTDVLDGLLETTVEVLISLGDPHSIVDLVQRLDCIFNIVVLLDFKDQESHRRALEDALNHPDKTIRSLSALQLSYLADVRSLNSLLEALKDEDADVRFVSVSAIAQIGSREAIPALLRTAMDSSQDVRKSVARTLGKLKAEEGVSVLLNMLNDPKRDVRLHAACALGKLGDPTGLPLILEVLRHSDKESPLLEDAIKAVGVLRYPAIPLLIAVARHLLSLPYESYIFQSLGETLAELGEPAVLDLIRGIPAQES